MLVQWSEVNGDRFGEMLLPVLPVAGQYITINDVEFQIVKATWIVEGRIVEGHISVEA